MHHCFGCFVWLAVVVSLVGCARSSGNPDLPPLVKVTGIVRYQGQPLKGADVTFNNSLEGYTAIGKTDASGKFVLTTSGQEGVVPGHQIVAVRRVEMIDNTPPGVDVSAGGVAPPPTIRWIVPERYANPATSGLAVDVKADGPNDIPLDLQ